MTDRVQPANLPLRVLHPFQPGIGENEDSIALGGRVGPLVLFTAGDLDQAGEKKFWPGIQIFVQIWLNLAIMGLRQRQIQR